MDYSGIHERIEKLEALIVMLLQKNGMEPPATEPAEPPATDKSLMRVDAHSSSLGGKPIEGYRYPFRIGDMITTGRGDHMLVYALSSSISDENEPVIILQNPKNLTEFDRIYDDEFHSWEVCTCKECEESEEDKKRTLFMEQLPSKYDWECIPEEKGTYEQFVTYNENKYNFSSKQKQEFIETILNNRHGLALMDKGHESSFPSVFFSTTTGRLVLCNEP